MTDTGNVVQPSAAAGENVADNEVAPAPAAAAAAPANPQHQEAPRDNRAAQHHAPSGPSRRSDDLHDPGTAKGHHHEVEGMKSTGHDVVCLSALSALFVKPIRKAGPDGVVDWKPAGCTYTVKNNTRTMMTQTVADPLYLLGYTYSIPTTSGTPVTGDNTRVDAMCNVVSTTYAYNPYSTHPGFSAAGQEWWDKLNTLTSSGQANLKDLLPNGNAIDQVAIATLMKANEQGLFMMNHDEAPLLRAILMLYTYMPGKWYAYRSTCLASLRYNPSAIKYVSSDYQKSNNRGTLDGTAQIQLASGTSTLYVVPLDIYVAYRSGHALRDIGRYKGMAINEESVIIPIRYDDMQQGWILPYIISHTTTMWWNHAVTHDYRVVDRRSSNSDTVVVKTMPRSCMAVVGGKYAKIVLVVVDMHAKIMPESVDVDSVGSVPCGATGYPDFSKAVFTFLGMHGDSPQPDTCLLLSNVAKLCENVAFKDTLQRIYSMANELSFGFSLGYSVRTVGEVPDSKDFRVSGPRMINNVRTNASCKIGQEEPGDLAKSWEDIKNWLMGKSDWCTSPLGLIPSSRVKIQNGSDHLTRFRLYSYSDKYSVYRVSETLSDIRVLRHLGVYEGLGICEEYKFESAVSILNFAQGNAMLMAGAAGWCMCRIGYNIMDLNGMANYGKSDYMRNDLQPAYHLATLGFVDLSVSRAQGYITTADFSERVKGFLADSDARRKKIIIKDWPSIHLTYRHIAAILMKLSGYPEGPTILRSTLPHSSDVPAPEDDTDENGFYMAFKVTAKEEWRTLPLLTSIIGYEMRDLTVGRSPYCRVLLPTATLDRVKDMVTGWLDYNNIDAVKGRDGSKGDQSSNPQIELLAIPLPIVREAYREGLLARAFVFDMGALNWAEGGQNFKFKEKYLKITWPDPIKEWLSDAMKYIADKAKIMLPIAFQGNLPGAVTAGVLSVAMDGLNSLFAKAGSDKRYDFMAKKDGSAFTASETL
ncbi:putative capsid [Anopheles totivirus]|uniref:Putative capsid n=1 Tax=Anopheles totivirus TaxID=1903415 RepID=A0A1C9U5D5_9VIRU|nr:putative capsid [Anopheles totivirus]